MDMGFHRRARQTNRQPSSELAALLGVLAARQAVSPTALAVTSAAAARDKAARPEISPFAAQPGALASDKAASSFHPGVSASLLSLRQSS
jgi:hypothetical protein